MYSNFRGARTRLGCLMLISGLLVAGCGAFARPLTHAHDSPASLASAVLAALERRDFAALREVALTEEEFRDHVWPDLPASRPERNLSFEYVWGDLSQKSEAALRETLAAHSGTRYDLVGVRFAGKTTQYESYLVHRDSELTVKDDKGVQGRLRLFGSVIEKDGRFKVFSYVVD